MAEKYFKRHGVLFMVSMETYKVHMRIGDCWVRTTDPEVRATIRLRSTEIPEAIAMALVVSDQNADGIPARDGLQSENPSCPTLMTP